MKFDLILDETSAGTVIGPRDGFVVNLKMTHPPDVLHPQPQIGAHFAFRDDRPVTPGLRFLVNFDPHNWTSQGQRFGGLRGRA